MIEAQVTCLVDMLRHLRRTGQDVVEVRRDVQTAFNQEVQSRMGPTVWVAGGCSSWNLDERGRNTTIWPDFTWRFKRRTTRFDPESYEIRAGAPVETAPAAAKASA
jgi:hypothetical protein